MLRWAGVAIALREAESDPLQSRLPVHLHPLAGRILAWHPLRALATLEPTPERILLAHRSEFDPAVLEALPVEPVHAHGGEWIPEVLERIPADIDQIMLVDAAAATLDRSLFELLRTRPPAVLRTLEGLALACWSTRAHLEAADPAATLDTLAAGAPETGGAAEERILITTRRDMARAQAVLRDRIVERHMERGVTFLLPESVLVDVDVEIGRDTIVYPNVVLEGKTTIGAETVVGPGCRIIDGIVGSGVELKGWNYIAGVAIRNRAVLEPYVRRGFD